MSEFDNIVAGLEFEDPQDVINVSALSTPELVDMLVTLEKELLDEKQALHPDMQAARDKHSLRNAIQVELSQRIENA